MDPLPTANRSQAAAAPVDGRAASLAQAPTCSADGPARVARLKDSPADALSALLAHYGIELDILPPDAAIPGSYWGAPEAGIIGPRLYAREDTPLHSVLHTAAHVVCMDAQRRAALHTDCGGDDLEEAAVCYLQALLAETITGYGRARLWADMDAWGYSFRLGSARAWFEQDAGDARGWLLAQGLIDARDRPTGRVRRA